MLYNSRNISELIFEIINVLSKHNITVTFVGDDEIDDDGEMISGSFDDHELQVACNKPFDQWFPIFLHEACHAEQMIEIPKKWKVIEKSYINWSYDLELNKKDKDNIKWVEQDCELRVLSYFKKVKGLPVSYKNYLVRAVLYVQYYDYYFDNGVWHGGLDAPYNKTKLIKFLNSFKISELENMLAAKKCPSNLYEYFGMVYE